MTTRESVGAAEVPLRPYAASALRADRPVTVPPVQRRLRLPALLVLPDLVGIGLAVWITGVDPLWAVTIAVLLLAGSTMARLYRGRLWLSYARDLPRSFATAAAALGIVTAIGVLSGGADQTAILCVLLAAGIAAPLRLGVFQIARSLRCRIPRLRYRTIVIGASTVGVELVRTMQRHPALGMEPVGFVDSSPPPPEIGPLPVPLLGGVLADAIQEHEARTVVLAFTNVRDADVVDIAITAHALGVTIFMVPRMFEMYHDTIDVERLRSYPLVRLNTAPTTRPAWLVKRLLDRVVAAVGLLVASPLLAAVALAVLREGGRPVLFRQDRIGRNGRTFQLLKFRSMRPQGEHEDQAAWSIAGDPRVGPVGRIMRRTSLDELPQLWNILRGDMSIVGPRPERPGFVEEFTVMHDRYWARHRVAAGLTGLAQVNGLRGDTSIADRARYDNYYIANWSLWLDLRIVVLTVQELFRRGQH